MKQALLVAVCAAFTGTAGAKGTSSTPPYTVPGLFFSIKNNCGFESAVNVADKNCLLNMGTWTAVTPIWSGMMADQEIASSGACADKVGGDGKIVFFRQSTAPDFIEVTVKPGSTIDIPKELCSRPSHAPLDLGILKIK